MKIRSITCFCHPGDPEFLGQLSALSRLVSLCKMELEDRGWEIQSARLATVPFSHYLKPETAIKQVLRIEEAAREHGFEYVSIGPARLAEQSDYQRIPEILAASTRVFANAFLSHHHHGISYSSIQACAKLIKAAATITPDGFTNLRFCAMSRVQPFTPFFPAAYAYDYPAFSIAIQAADAAVQVFSNASVLSEAREQLVGDLDAASAQIGKVAAIIAGKMGIPFKGFDFSLAPFPEEWCSLGKAIETLAGASIGSTGTLASAAILAETLDRGHWQRAGFNGLMLPVLEDSTLAARSEGHLLSVKDLLLFSAVCGTGLDTVPLPGDIAEEAIESLLMDLAALSLRLNKPLTARLMPIPGYQAGDATRFEFDFFANGKILDFPAGHLSQLLTKEQWVQIHQRHPN